MGLITMYWKRNPAAILCSYSAVALLHGPLERKDTVSHLQSSTEIKLLRGLNRRTLHDQIQNNIRRQDLNILSFS
jgi:hypothetical protein